MLKTLQLPYKFNLRWYQRQVWNAFFHEQYKQLMFIWHRRAGKDDLCINILTGAALREVGYYYYLFPKHKQARQVIWDGITNDGVRFIHRIPSSLVVGENSTHMKVKLINGSVIQIAGSDNYDTLMGNNAKGIIYSEFALQNPFARQYLRPIIVANGGFELLNTTPRGMNHAYHLYNAALADPKNWFTSLLTVDETFDYSGKRIITPEMLDVERAQGTREEVIQSEYYCNFESAVVGAYFADQLREARKQKRIGKFPIDPRHPVFLAFDIGRGDATGIWFIQVIQDQMYLRHYHEAVHKTLPYFVEYTKKYAAENGIKYSKVIFPHDGVNIEWVGTGKTRFEMWKEYTGLLPEIVRRCAPNGIKDEIEQVRRDFSRMYIDEAGCAQGLMCLAEYHAEFKEDKGEFKEVPDHNWASHCADALRTWCMWFNRERLQPLRVTKQKAYNPLGTSPNRRSG